MRRHAVMGLASAVLFGITAPLSKLLLQHVGPFMLAALLYLGAGLAVLPFAVARALGGDRGRSLRGADAPLLLGMVAMGGLIGPLCLLWGLARTPALSASLLLNLEAPLTMLLAVAVLRERLTFPEWTGAAFVMGAGATLSALPAGPLAFAWGGGWVVLACAAWAVDNNLAAKVSQRDPMAVTCVKALPAGVLNLGLGFARGEPLPSARGLAAALMLGALGYGASIVLNLRAVRALGAARQAALFSTAPFAGAALAIPLLGDRLPWPGWLAAAVMAGGTALLVDARSMRDSGEREKWASER